MSQEKERSVHRKQHPCTACLNRSQKTGSINCQCQQNRCIHTKANIRVLAGYTLDSPDFQRGYHGKKSAGSCDFSESFVWEDPQNDFKSLGRQTASLGVGKVTGSIN